jgi:hypothetical protein
MSYRDADTPPRYLCIVCWRTVSPVEGQCCGVPLVPIEGETLDELRRRARAARERPGRRRLAFGAGGALVAAVFLNAALIATGVYHLGPTRGGWGRQGGAGLVAVGLTVGFLAFYLLMQPLARRLFPDGERFDPDSADVPTLLRHVIPR